MRVLIVDDEPLARDSARLVLATDPEVEVVGACTGTDAPALVASLRPDLLVLDVQMPKLDGFGVLAAIGPDAVPTIIFVTAFYVYGVRGFEVNAHDSVLTPFDDKRLLAALARAKQHMGQRDKLANLLDAHERGKPHLQRFIVRGRDRALVISAEDVDSIEAADDYVELHVGGSTHVLRERLSDLEARLDPTRFVRIHRSAIVNVARVREVHPLVRGDALVVLTGGASFRCSRSRRAELVLRLSDSPKAGHRSPQQR
jgi:two-component system LytT family response regulator